LFLAALVCGVAAGPATAQIENDQCQKCHGAPTIADMRSEALAGMVRIPAGQSPVMRARENVGGLYVPDEGILGSVHAGLRCTDCHPGIDRLPHNQRLASLACGDCHASVEGELSSGMHRPLGADEAGRHRPNCADCHGPAHEIQAVGEKRGFEQAKAQALACMQCHGAEDGEVNHAATYRENIHGRGLFEKGLTPSATCVDCHGAHAVLRASDPQSPTHPLNVPETCGRCHQGIEEVFFGSVHGQHLLDGDAGAASCASCHHSHGIQATDNAFLHAIVQECSHCHLDLGKSYLTSYHGKATTLGSEMAAVCSSCHGAHDILPPSDPRSHVAPENLQRTCGKCHEGVNANFVKYFAHAEVRDRAKNPQVFWTWLIMTTLLLSVLAVFVPHGVLWFQRSLVDRLRNPKGYHVVPKGTRWVMRFRPVHRVTHFLIVISFMGLVITGFPLKYSYTHWALAIAESLGGIHVLGLLHRMFALVTFAYAGVHLVFLIWFFTVKCPRPRMRYLIGPDSLIFNWKDLKDFFAMIRWFCWLGPRPKFDRWAYFEKFDYFGELWGVFLIGGTGLILWFPTVFTRWMPGWVLNCAMVIHSIEALLAASVIFLVHFFNTHLRPEKFPVDMVMLVGSMTETEMEEERPAEYERLKASGELEGRIVEPPALHWRLVGAIFGVLAFLTGIFLIVLALRTELSQILGH
jgi:cytochrome b subunit of formate dehydrogenase/5-methylcytosine-specific restriction endonuclease McrA